MQFFWGGGNLLFKHQKEFIVCFLLFLLLWEIPVLSFWV